MGTEKTELLTGVNGENGVWREGWRTGPAAQKQELRGTRGCWRTTTGIPGCGGAMGLADARDLKDRRDEGLRLDQLERVVCGAVWKRCPMALFSGRLRLAEAASGRMRPVEAGYFEVVFLVFAHGHHGPPSLSKSYGVALCRIRSGIFAKSRCGILGGMNTENSSLMRWLPGFGTRAARAKCHRSPTLSASQQGTGRCWRTATGEGLEQLVVAKRLQVGLAPGGGGR